MWQCVLLCFEQWKCDVERHGHSLKGNATLNHIGPKTFAAFFSVGLNFGACCVSGPQRNQWCHSKALHQLSKAKYLLWYHFLGCGQMHTTHLAFNLCRAREQNFYTLFDSVFIYLLRPLFSLLSQAWFVHSFSPTSQMLAFQVSHNIHFPVYLIHSSSDGLSDSSFSLSSSSGRSPHRSKFRPVASSLLRVDTASLLNIQKWPLLQESRQGLQGATTW